MLVIKRFASYFVLFRAPDGNTQVQEDKQRAIAAEPTKRDQVVKFWDEAVNGRLVQTPLDLDWGGRGWCKV